MLHNYLLHKPRGPLKLSKNSPGPISTLCNDLLRVHNVPSWKNRSMFNLMCNSLRILFCTGRSQSCIPSRIRDYRIYYSWEVLYNWNSVSIAPEHNNSVRTFNTTRYSCKARKCSAKSYIPGHFWHFRSHGSSGSITRRNRSKLCTPFTRTGGHRKSYSMSIMVYQAADSRIQQHTLNISRPIRICTCRDESSQSLSDRAHISPWCTEVHPHCIIN